MSKPKDPSERSEAQKRQERENCAAPTMADPTEKKRSGTAFGATTPFALHKSTGNGGHHRALFLHITAESWMDQKTNNPWVTFPKLETFPPKKSQDIQSGGPRSKFRGK